MPESNDLSQHADLLRNGIVQKFELVSELLWKTVRFFLLHFEGEDIRSLKKVIKGLLNFNYVDEQLYELLFQIMDWRIKLTHVYKKELFDEAITEIPNYLNTIKQGTTLIKHTK